MRRNVIEEKIKQLQKVKEHIEKDTLLPEDLFYIYDNVTVHKNIWYGEKESYTRFYVGDEEDTSIHRVEALVPYEKGIDQIRVGMEEDSLTIAYKDVSEKYGASVILTDPPRLVEVYEPDFTSIKKVGSLYVRLRDSHKKLYESIVTLTGDTYRVKEKGQYMGGFSLEKCPVFTLKRSKETDILFYDGKPIYFYDYEFTRKQEIENFIELHSQRIHPAFREMTSQFDESFILGEYGPQKHL